MKSRTMVALTTLVTIGILLSSLAPHAAEAYRPAAAAQATHNVYLPQIRNGSTTSSDTTTYDVVYNSNTRVIDQATMTSGYISTSADGTTFTFKSSATSVRQLRAGQIVIFAGKALRKVSSVVATSTQIVVKTTDTTLDKAIVSGNIGWSHGVDWQKVPLSALSKAKIGPAGSTLALTASAPTAPFTYKGKIQGWNVILTLQPVGNSLQIDITANQTIGGAKAKVTGTGTISTFSQESFLSYQNSTPDTLSTQVKGLRGDMELKWGSISPNGEQLTDFPSITIPAEIPLPIEVGPIPVVISVKAALQVVPALYGEQASSGGDLKTSWSSDQGFQIQHNTASVTGQLGSSTFGLGADPTVSAGFGPAVGFGMGIEFPRIELSLFGLSTPVALVTVKTYSYGFFGTEPPCQKGGTKLLAVAGYNLTFLGFTIAKDTKDIWQHEWIKYKDDKQC